MITVGIVLALLLVGFLWPSPREDAFGICGIVAFLIATIGWGVGGSVGETYVWEKRDLVAIADGTGFHGYISLFGGSVDSDARYRFYWQDGSQLILENVQASEVILTEDSPRPYFEHLKGCHANPIIFWPITWCATDGDEKSYRIHVPPGSVTRKVDLNLNP
ncbi:hypothetical protein [Mycobacterium phage WXIN]|nr:hypothetical protein [Mycobacterium phage WXIN]